MSAMVASSSDCDRSTPSMSAPIAPAIGRTAIALLVSVSSVMSYSPCLVDFATPSRLRQRLRYISCSRSWCGVSVVERQRRDAAERRAGDELGVPAVGADRHVADERDAVQRARLVVGDVTRWLVRSRAVVPERHAARPPPEAHRVLRTGQLFEEEVEQ